MPAVQPPDDQPAGARERLLRLLPEGAEGPGPTVAVSPPASSLAPPAPVHPPDSPVLPFTALSFPPSVSPPVSPPASPPESPPGGLLARLGGAAAFDPGRRGVRALAAVAVLVVVGAAALAWWSRPRPEPLAPQPPVAVAATLPPSGPAELVVAVTGLVREPGLVRLPPGARVADAIEAAGGVLPDADVSYLNLARKLADGELVAVGIPPPPGAVGPAGPGSTGGKVDLNLATQAELETLPGVGPALAGRIIDYRTEHGRFRSITELREVSGIGEVRFAELRDLVTV